MQIPRRLLHALAAPLLLAAATGCGASHPAASAPAPVPTASPTATPSAAASTPAATPTASATPTLSAADAQTGQQLLAHLLPVPAGMRPWKTNGLLDLDQFVNSIYVASAAEHEKGMFTRRRFVVAARHAWIGNDGSQSDIVLVKFAADTGAQSMYDGLSRTWKDDPESKTFTDSDDDQAVGVIHSKLDDLGNAKVALAVAEGDTLVFVHYFTAATPDQAGAQDLLHRQLAALKASGTSAGA